LLERRDGDDGSEDLFLKHAHRVVSLEDRRMNVVAVLERAVEHVALAADEHFRALFAADVEVRKDLLELLARRLRADHRAGIERISLLDRFDAFERALHELVVDRLFDQRARRAGAHLALVEREHHEAFDRLIEEVVVFGCNVGEENVRRLAAEFERHRE
jgi:hypothetical protein